MLALYGALHNYNSHDSLLQDCQKLMV